MTFLDRELNRPVAFVLGGGASSSAAQVGMLRAIREIGLEPDLIVGTSAGALNGVILADDPENAVERLAKIWSSCTRDAVLGERRLQRVRTLLKRQHLYASNHLSTLFAAHARSRYFDELRVPFFCVATDLDSGFPVVLHSGLLRTALLATTAVPGVFPVVTRDGRRLSDGLCVANVPIRQALELGAGTLVVFDGRPQIGRRGPFRDVRDTIAAAVAAVLSHQLKVDLEYARERARVIHLPGQPAERLKAFDFTCGLRLMTDAYEASRVFLTEGRSANPNHVGAVSDRVDDCG